MPKRPVIMAPAALLETSVLFGRGSGGLGARLVIPLAGIVIFAIFAAIRSFDPGLYRGLFLAWGVRAYWMPFVDLQGVLSAIECYRYGFDVYADNPCDVLGRVFNYSPLFLVLSVFHVTDYFVAPAGVTLSLLFLIAVASLPLPRGRYAWTITLLATFSTTTAFAVERQNFDVSVFILAVLAVRFLANRRFRAVGYGVAMFLSVLKLYPIFLFFLTLRERKTIFVAVNVAASVAIVAMVAVFHADLARALAAVPIASDYTDAFGAKNLPDGLAELIGLQVGAKVTPNGTMQIVIWSIWALLLLQCAWRGARIAADPSIRARLVSLATLESLYLCAGCVFIVGCFFAAQNIGYRGIFFLLALPGLLALARDGKTPIGILSERAVTIVVFLMWSECLHHILSVAYYDISPRFAALVTGFWLVRELAWWHLIGILVGLLGCFALDSEIGIAFRSVFRAGTRSNI